MCQRMLAKSDIEQAKILMISFTKQLANTAAYHLAAGVNITRHILLVTGDIDPLISHYLTVYQLMDGMHW